MANETIKLEPVELSQLPPIESPSDFWVFGSKKDSNGNMTSGRYSLDKLEEYARTLQLERRISITMETNSLDMLFGEAMTIYKVEAVNVDKLFIDEDEIVDFMTKDIKKEIGKMSIVNLKISRQSVDTKAYLFIYAKAKTI